MSITITKVESKKDLAAFVHFPNSLYKDNPYYVPQIESMDRDTLDPNKNHAFEVCQADYFLAKDENGKVVGRVAAIINESYNKKVNQRICRFGWLDFEEDPQIVNALMQRVEQYAAEHDLNIVNGPVGFLEFDAAGILVDGFDKLPTAYGKYNAPYYDPMITALGYEKDVDWVEYLVDISDYNPERNHRAAALVSERFGLKQAKIESKKDVKKYIPGIFAVMNRCYARIHGYSDLTPGQLDDLKNQFLPNVDPDLLSVILDNNDKVVAFCVWMPSLSKAMQKAKGKLFPFGFIHILKALKHNDTADTLLIAVDEEYQNKGLNAMFFDKEYKGVKKIGIKYLETTRELEINNSVLNLSGKYERKLIKRARSYIKTI